MNCLFFFLIASIKGQHQWKVSYFPGFFYQLTQWMPLLWTEKLTSMFVWCGTLNKAGIRIYLFFSLRINRINFWLQDKVKTINIKVRKWKLAQCHLYCNLLCPSCGPGASVLLLTLFCMCRDFVCITDEGLLSFPPVFFALQGLFHTSVEALDYITWEHKHHPKSVRPLL